MLIIGLGNPGAKYEKSRHNVGFFCIEKLAKKLGVEFKKSFSKPFSFATYQNAYKKVILVKPETYMNLSGAVLKHFNKDEKKELLVFVDNMDLKPGKAHFKFSGGTAGHNGLKSIEQNYLGSDYYRLYIGVGHPESRDFVTDWVLATPNPVDKVLIEEAVERGVGAIYKLIERESVTLSQDEISQINNQLQ